jgi:hypothetical protein
MLMPDSVSIYSSTDRDYVQAMAENLHRAGITCVLLPSDRTLGAWDIEVSPDDVVAAREIANSVRSF